MLTLLAIGIGGFVGSITRYGAARGVFAVAGGTFPLGTLAVNVCGSFLLGLILTASEIRPLDPNVRAGLAVGFCGGFTTMSTFSFETLALIERGSLPLALANVLTTVVLCQLSVWLGVAAARIWD